MFKVRLKAIVKKFTLVPTCSEETSAHLKSLVVAEKIEMENRMVNKKF